MHPTFVPGNQPTTFATHSTIPTVSREGTNGLLISGLPTPTNLRIEKSVLDRILLTYKKYLCNGSSKARLKHEAGDYSDGGHYSVPLSYSYSFTRNPANNTADLHIDFWLSTTPAPYISAEVPLPEAATPDDTFDKWVASQARLQVQNLIGNQQNESPANANITADRELTKEDLEWRDRLRTRAMAAQAKIDRNEPKIPDGYRPMVIQEVHQIFGDYLEIIKADLEVFFQQVHQDAVANQAQPDYLSNSYSFLPAFYHNPSPRQ